MNKMKLFSILLSCGFIAACSFGKNTVNVDEVKKIKSIAVIIYTVPDQIVYKDDPRHDKEGILAALAETAIGKNGYTAADTAVKSFTATLQKQGLPFKVMPHSQVVANAKFTALHIPRSTVSKQMDKSFTGKALSFFGSMSGSKSKTGAAPEKMNQYGLVSNWAGDTALTRKADESEYIKKAIEALKVDAVLIVNDPGFSFVCEACIGLAGSFTGAASTGSAFNATLVSRTGPVMNIREWFATTDEQAAMVAGIVNPTEHKSLFEEHGRKMAQVFAAAAKESLAAK